MVEKSEPRIASMDLIEQNQNPDIINLYRRMKSTNLDILSQDHQIEVLSQYNSYTLF